jgi:bifunctional enzyme CysN/CysC
MGEDGLVQSCCLCYKTSMKNATPLRLVLAGHVDHGKSTLVGRLLHETGSLAEGKQEAIEASCKKRGQPFEWAFVTDALQTERDQNVTIEAAHIVLKTKSRNIVLIDAPGHREFLKNMATAAAGADAALLLIDAKEGISEQTRKHADLLALMGIRQVAVLVNKMDAVGYKQKTFKALAAKLKTLGIKPVAVIPISAREGDSVTRRSPRMAWYKGQTALAALEKLSSSKAESGLPLRFLVQDVYKKGDKRILAGRVESGSLKCGDTLVFSPVNTKAKVASVEVWNKKTKKAGAGESIGITLDQPLFIERGQVASHSTNAPLLTNVFRARIFWLGKSPLENGARVKLALGTLETDAEIRCEKPVACGDIAEVTLRARGQIAVDGGALNRFSLKAENDIRGGGVVIMEGLRDQRHLGAAKSKNIASEHFGITADMRAGKNGHSGGVLWFTGLPSSGKSTIARLVQKKLFDLGCQVFVLDGDNVRQGLSRDLGFSARDRGENIRRVAEAAALFAESGMIVITAFISPYEEDRDNARAISGAHSIYIKASLAACKKRDPKGLYKKARAGKIAGFTGISAPYEEPKTPDLVLDTETANADSCADALVAYVTRHLIETVT